MGLVVAKEKIPVLAPATYTDLGAAYAALRVSLRNYMRRRVGDPVVVEDLVQAVFVKATAAISAHRGPSNLTGWLYATARTTVADYYRAMGPAMVALDDKLPDSQHAGDEHFHQELATCLGPLVRQLPAIYRDTLVATDFDGKTMRSLADEQNLSLSAIKSRASRARVMLKEKLQECCHVEMENGLVTDYHRRGDSVCRGGCG